MCKVGSTRERKEEYKDAFLHQNFLVGWDPVGTNSTVVEMAVWKHLEFSFSSSNRLHSGLFILNEWNNSTHFSFFLKKHLTSRSHGFSFLSNKISNPRTSKQTLSLPGGWPGLHIRYACRTWGSATIRVFTTNSYKDCDLKKKNEKLYFLLSHLYTWK